MRLRRACPHLFWPLLFCLTLFSSTAPSHAQASPTASKSLEISVFAAYSRLHPDFGPPLNGLTAGLDVAGPIRYRFLLPALEVRANYAGETVSAGEELIVGGVRLGLHIAHTERLKPYVNFLVGAGQINFNNPGYQNYSKDNSVIYNYGAGVDCELVRNFALKVEFQHQNWDLGHSAPDTRVTLTPSSFNVGVSYRIPSWRR